jgi:hypothetical protein
MDIDRQHGNNSLTHITPCGKIASNDVFSSDAVRNVTNIEISSYDETNPVGHKSNPKPFES